MSPPDPVQVGVVARDRLLLALALMVQLAVLYAPRAPAVGGGVGVDKVVHVLVFGAVAVAALRCGLPSVPVLLVSAAHAVVSELAQALLLSGRSGDPADVVADLVGVGVGALLHRARRHRAAGRAG